MQTFGVSQNTNLSAVERFEMIQAETRKSTTTISASKQLICPSVASNNLIVWQAGLYFAGGTPGNFKLQWITPSTPATGGVLQVTTTPVGYGVTTGYNADIVVTGFAGAADIVVQLFYGWFVNGATPGEFGLSWAQNGSNVTASVLTLGCWLEILRR